MSFRSSWLPFFAVSRDQNGHFGAADAMEFPC
jgi:hypothetical protein